MVSIRKPNQYNQHSFESLKDLYNYMNTTIFTYDDVKKFFLPFGYPHSIFCFKTVVFTIIHSLSL